MDVYPMIAAQRRAVADVLETLEPQDWDVQSLCGEWTVRHVAAHMAPERISMLEFGREMIRAKGSFETANVAMTERLAARPTTQLVANLRRFAERRWTPPTMPPAAPLTDALVHAQDIMIPLGIDQHAPVQAWCEVLDFLTSPAARRGFLSAKLPDVAWVATDAQWRCGEGPEVQGSCETIALAMLGRRPAPDHLSGPGTDVVRKWVETHR